MTDRTPPHDDHAEQSVLGAMLLSTDAIQAVTAITRPEDHYQPAHQIIHAAILTLHEAGQAVDAITLAAHLTETGEINRAGGHLAIANLLAATPTAANADHYARIVADRAARRRLIDAGTRIAALGYATDGETLDGLQTAARTELEHATSTTGTGGTWIAGTLDQTLEAASHATLLAPTPWRDLNHLIGGFAPGGLYVIGARPGIGKTLMATNIATHLGAHGPVAFSALEMSAPELQHRIIAQLAHVDVRGFRDATLTPTDRQRINAIRDQYQSLQISIDDNPAATINDITTHARHVADHGPLQAVIVDYLQLMESGHRIENRQTEVAQISRRLKVLAKQLHTPVIALSQLNRGPEARLDKRPTLADLRESGAIEQDADVVLLLHMTEDDPETLYLQAAKNRHGPTGAITLNRQASTATITGTRQLHAV